MQQQPKNDLVYLLQMLESIGKIQVYSLGFKDALDFFQANEQLNFNASLLLFSHIGEQVNKLSKNTKEKYSDID